MDTFRSADGLPEPERSTVAVPPSLIIVRVPLADPVLAGANCTPIWQLPPGAMAPPPEQPSEIVNGAVTVVPATCRLVVPALVTVMVCGLLTVPMGTGPNARPPGATAMRGFTPVPVSATVSGLDPALLVILSVPDCGPIVFGEKVTVMTHDWPGSSGLPHAVASAVKSPVVTGRPTIRLAVPVFVTVTVCAWLVPTCCWPKSRLLGLRLTAGAVPVPVSART